MTTRSPKVVVYRVETDRLVLRCWSPGDAVELRRVLSTSSQHLRPWIPFMKDEPRTLEQTCQWLRETRAGFDRDEAYHFAVFDRRSGELLGGNMLNPRVGPGALELGYWMRLESVGQGLASEATSAMVRAAFEVYGVERVEIHCAVANQASAAIPSRLGFRHEATLKKRATNADGEAHDLMIWSLFSEDYESSPARRLRMRAFDGSARSIEIVGEDGYSEEQS